MSRRTKISIIVIIIILILLALVLFLWRWMPDKEPAVIVVDPGPTIEIDEPDPNGPKEMLPEEVEPIDVSLETLAKTFGERYGSYSNESDFANLYDLMPLMTSSMQGDTEDLIERVVVADVYYGITTRVLSTELVEYEEELGYATMNVLTQREEAMGSPQNAEVKYQTLVLEMVKQGGTWKVNKATWEL